MRKELVGTYSKGFTLVEIMVAVGLLGVLSLGVMRMMSSSMKMSKDVSQRAERSQIGYIAMLNLRNKLACERTFAGTDGFQPAANPAGAGTDVDAIWNARPDPAEAREIIEVGQVYGEGGDSRVTVERITISDFPAGDGVVDTAKVTIELDRGQMVNDASDFIIEMDVQVVTNGGVVETCFTNEIEYVEAACISLGGTVDRRTPPDLGKCKNLVITNNSALPSDTDNPGSENYAMQALGPVRIYGPQLNDGAAVANTGGLIVSSLADLAPAPGEGNLLVTGNAEVETDAMVRRSMMIGAGNPSEEVGDLDIEKDFSALGDATVRGGAVIGSGTPPDPNNLLVEESIGVGDGLNAPGGDGRLHTKNGVMIGENFGSGAALAAGKFNETGRPNLVVSGNVVILADEQRAVTNFSDNTAEHAATVGWVRNRIAKTLAPAAGDVGKIVADILLNSSGDSSGGDNAAYEVIKNYVCSMIRIENKDGAVAGFSLVGNRCVFDDPDTRCDEDGVCTKVYADEIELNGDARTAWPNDCSVSGECSQVCIDNDCKRDWNISINSSSASCSWTGAINIIASPTNSTATYINRTISRTCPGGDVMRGWRATRLFLRSSGVHHLPAAFSILCCDLNSTVSWPTY